jgi:penicillin-insensitive murein endopeptidase
LATEAALRNGWALALAGFLLLAVPGVLAADPPAPQSLRTPGKGAPDPIGSYANGCIRGAVELPPDGAGYQVMNLSRRRNWGHPDLLSYLHDLAGKASAEKLGRLAIGDLGMVRGGRMPTGHASHQMGLDADIWFVLDLPPLPPPEREREDFASMVDAKAQRVDPSRFGPAQARLLQLAAEDSRVSRIFVNPAIKLALCQQTAGDRAWLAKLRPWFGHAAHFHVRLSCPAGAGQCEGQEPPPSGDGCGAELMSWFAPPPPNAKPPAPPKAPPPPPAACLALYAEP